jgi:hypothetical protein
MFRYGGPIKEGIMDGIREPKRDGNIVGGRQSPKLAGAHPLKDASGREHHLLPAGVAIGAGLNALRIGAMRMAPRVFSGIRNFFQTQKPAPYSTVKIGQSKGGQLLNLKPKVIRNVKDTVPKEQVGTVFQTRPYFANDPLFATGSKIIQGITSPTSKGLIQKGARLVTSPTGVLTGLYFAGGKFFDGDGNEVPPPANVNELKLGDRIGTSGAPGGGDPGMYLTPQAKGGEGATLSKEELRKKRVERYRDIMDIKGMNKAAAYDSLIAASKAIGESGDFKGDLKSGRLINQIIQSTSKAFDKPKQTKDAIDTLILKAEIDKDIKASDPQAQKKAQLLEKQIQIADKTLAGDTFTDIITERYSKGKVPRGKELAGILRATEGVEVTTVDSTKIPQGVDAQTFFESEINKAKEKGTAVVPGYYVIDDRVLIVDEQGNVTPVL